MREVLLKKRYGIPTALLILLVSAGVATAFVVENFTFSITTAEPLTFKTTDDLEIEYQGESDNIIVQVQNLSTKTSYGIFVDATVENIDSITYSSDCTDALKGTEQDEGNVNSDSDTWDAWYNIAAGYAYKIYVTVDSADDVAAEGLSVELKFYREVEY